MPSKSTPEPILLRAFSERRDEAAFRELVRRHLSMVVGVAKRRVGDYQTAEDIAQKVFIKLARKAANLDPDSIIGAWLHRVTVQEAMDYHRSEYRRRRAMKAYQNQQENGVESLPSELLNGVDDALAAMTSRDRSAIMLRYHGGLSYKEIGTRLGKTEEAARKQVTRALSKLAKRLGKVSGTAFSLPALSGGLWTTFGGKTEAAATTVSTIAETALAAASAPIGTVLATHLLLIMKSKLTIGAFLMALASFFAGRQTASSFDRRVIEQSYHSSMQRDVLSKKAAGLAHVEAPSGRSMPEIIAEAVEIAEEHGMAAFYRLRRILEELDPQDYEAALAHLEGLDLSTEAFHRLGSLLAGLWAYQHGEAAMDWVTTHLDPLRGPAMGHVLRAWSASSPETAYTRYREMANADDHPKRLGSFRWLAKDVFAGWADHDPESAVTALRDVSIENEDCAIFGIAAAIPKAADPERILKAIEAMPPTRIRAKLITESATTWATEEPHAAAAWVDSITDWTVTQQWRARVEVAEEWMRYDSADMVAIGAWMLSGAPDSRKHELTQMINDAITRQQAAQR